MKLFVFALLAAVAFGHVLDEQIGKLTPYEVSHNTWVVLVAGSNGWGNYRHQADVCHGYQAVHEAGVPDDHIIVMMYDDLAFNSRNPDKGVIINVPDGPDVYKGVPHDYTGNQVTAANFIKIMSGENPGVGSGKYLQSTKQDHVFLYYDDHGGPGEICFPVGGDLTSTKFGQLIDAMSQKGMFRKLFLIVQACYSGSMFYKQNLPPNVYGVTSAPVGASAFAFNYVNKLGTYVASRYAYAVWDGVDKATSKTTWQDHFDGCWAYVKNWSQPCQYGDLSIAKMGVQSFFNGPERIRRNARAAPAVDQDDAVPQWEVPLQIAKNEYARTRSVENLAILKQEEMTRIHIDSAVMSILSKSSPSAVARLNTVPCDKCDNTCPCYQYADGGAEAKKFVCCNEQSCFSSTPKSQTVDSIMECGIALSQAFSRECGPRFEKHPYVAFAQDVLFRACRTQMVNLPAALNAIHDVCSA